MRALKDAICASLRPHPDSGFTVTELAAAIFVVVVLIGIGIPFYLRSLHEGYDTATRSELGHVVEASQSRLLRDRVSDYTVYGRVDAFVDQLQKDEPALELKPVGRPDADPSDNIVTEPGEVGVGIQKDGAVVFAAMSKSGTCWLARHDPNRGSEGVEWGKGDPDNCGLEGDWIDDPGTSNRAPVVYDDTVLVPSDTDPVFIDLARLASDDDLPEDMSLTFVPNFEADPNLQGTLEMEDATTVRYTPAPGTAGSQFFFTFYVSDGELTSGEAKITLQIAAGGTGTTDVALDCTPSSVPYGTDVECVVTGPGGTELGVGVDLDWDAAGIDLSDCSGWTTCEFTSPEPAEVEVSVFHPGEPTPAATDTVAFTAEAPQVIVSCASPVSYLDNTFCEAYVDADPNGDAFGPADFTWVSMLPDPESGAVVRDEENCGAATNTCAFGVDVPTDVSVTVSVNDPHLGPVEASTTVTFKNEAPTAPELSCPGPYYHIADPAAKAPDVQPVTCTAQGSVDPDAPEGATDLTYRWTFQNAHRPADLAPLASFSETASVSEVELTSDEPGVFVEVSVVAVDSFGTESEPTFTRFEFVNLRPVITAVVCESPVDYNTNTTCTQQSSDPNGDPLTFVWRHPGATPNPVNGPNATFRRTTPGSITTTLTATDPYGSQATRDGTAVFINTPPQVSVTCGRTNGGAATTNKVGSPTVRCVASVYDPNQTSGFGFSWSASPSALGLSNNATGPRGNCSVATCIVRPDGTTGSFVPQVTVTDAQGAKGTAKGNAVTVRNDPVSVQLSGCTVNAGQWCTLTAQIKDPDDSSGSLSWSYGSLQASNCATSVSGLSASWKKVTCRVRTNSPGSSTVKVTASTAGSSASASATATFKNRPPTLTYVTRQCVSSNGQNCVVSVKVSDPDGQNVTVNWGNLSGNAEGGTIANRVAGNCNGTYSSGSTVTCAYRWTGKDMGQRLNATLSATVTATDPSGAKVSGSVSARWPNPAAQNPPGSGGGSINRIECWDPKAGVWGPSNFTAAYNYTVTCRVKEEYDPHGISHRFWDVNCNMGGGGEGTECKLRHTGTSVNVQTRFRDRYCGKPRCAGGDGSQTYDSNVIKVTWEKPPPPPPPPPGKPPGCYPSLSIKPHNTKGTTFTASFTMKGNGCADSGRWGFSRAPTTILAGNLLSTKSFSTKYWEHTAGDSIMVAQQCTQITGSVQGLLSSGKSVYDSFSATVPGKPGCSSGGSSGGGSGGGGGWWGGPN